ncbi:hypothetical protein AAZX31_15G234600 [Glycine max]|uniref:Receptor-like serine/threonine-protein kinase n=1 Tax=Glycine max TaxID=3847 RepID=K7MDU4_SOYBN|nr:G-type lectin S-receptor-like serine/threonine-protein kinase LECRK2 [Glycine max]KAG4950369.1 hypothetical protein JHK86_043608 [Glycine max]KAG4957898.1 hypothetical protein JHK85_044278 [Glycine max]KAG5117689.1 hypothetical protein JHK84_043802 [Glycine max]KAH1148758.1 hypothetical protein GYH30_043399 [Glycine max]KRH13601.1 hypothetical protein GLYMA_15G250200v4 [Glycine max]|eukprot:XP_003545892.1 G-type lectin S-receptor-like serine/threonine-protein kinase LECRK2 [Glycine max]
MASPLLPFLFLSMVLLPFQHINVMAQTKSNIAIGDSHTAGASTSPWLVSSPSGDFAFGFLPLEDTPDHFMLCIWYAKIQDKTIVWFANRDKPAPKGSKVVLTADDGLVLITAPNGNQLWKTGGLTVRVSSGVLNNTGNFVLQDGDSNTVWESFKDYRDTLLPYQTMERGQKLSSKLRRNYFNKGRFVLFFQNDGNLVMHSINLPSGYANEHYYESGTVESNISSAGTQLVFDGSGDMYVLRENNEKYNLSRGGSGASSTTQFFYLRATLDFDGVFTLYQHPKGSSGTGGWTPVWSHPDNICKDYVASAGSGVCGYNSICSLRDDKRPNCKCPKWYSLVDPNDPNGSCKPDFVQACAVDELSNRKDLYDFEVLIDTDWPQSDYVLQRPFNEEQCRQSCMEDCMCSVAIFRLGDSCWKKKLPLSNGRVDATLNGAKAFMKVRKDNSSLIVPTIIVNKNRNTSILVGSVLLGSSAFLNLILLGAICLSTSYVFRYKKKLRSIGRSDTIVETNLRCFTYKELEKATDGFDKVLGKGAFGIVYEGVINMGSDTRVAVKRLNTFLLEDVHKEFKNELNAIGLTHHKNLVRILGFCETEEKRLLVYEYMSNGTLASLLFNILEKPSWELRLQIAIGVARGLLYLHEECSTQIIHCDIKPQNILLDDYYNARISDFGLAKLLNMNQSRTNTAIRGTKGYVALEWFKNMPITAKVDVYSYGVLLLEIVSCRKSVEFETEDKEKAILAEWAYDCYTERTLHALVEGDKEALDDMKNLEKLVMIALWCVQEDPDLRPTMRNVTQMLEGVVEVKVPPCPSQISDQYS